MEKIYRLTPACKDNLWGGNRLRSFGKQSNADRIAESWELSFTDGGEARISDGRKMSEAFGKESWGSSCEKFEFFPTLTKFIDAREKLSVQVHPSDEYALSREGQYGKTEMWYVVDAEEGAGLYMGLRRKCTPEEFSQAVSNGTVEELLEFKKVKAGDVFFIPSGTIHAIGSGVLIFEIQQNSTLTYRLYDYMRRDKDGGLRELHVDKAMAVSKLDVYEGQSCDGEKPEVIGKCAYFETAKYTVTGEISLNCGTDSFLAITCVGGEGTVEGECARAGDSFFCPAGAGCITLSSGSGMEIIAVKIPENE